MTWKLKWLWTTLVNGWRSSTFKTEQEAAFGVSRDLEFRCAAVRDKRMVKSEDPVNRHSATGASLLLA